MEAILEKQLRKLCAVDTPMVTNCARLLADLFLYSYEAKFIKQFLHEKNKYFAVAFGSQRP
jgi:hypothetical protein